LARRVFAKVPLLSLVLMLVGSEALAVVPTRVAAGLAAVCPLVLRDVPVPSPRIRLSMIWHRGLDNHPAHRWLRATVRASIARE
jgi:DNA-binding transcriptional LysR family regulator